MVPIIGMDDVEVTNILPLAGSDLRPFDRPARAVASRYTDCSTLDAAILFYIL
jgi:hypothetical protein